MGNSQGQSQGSLGGATKKIRKAKVKVVKPILKKLSHSEKNSLDLDRGWDEQRHTEGLYGTAGGGRSAKDVSFSFGIASARGVGGRVGTSLEGKETDLNSASAISTGNVARKTFQHGRSHSGNSVATNGSGGPGMRAGSFVHPFQQMPRTSTPPLSYANSLASFDNNSSAPRDYSPTITENEDDGELNLVSNFLNAAGQSLPPQLHFGHHHHHHSSFSSHHQSAHSAHSSTFSQSGLRRPSLASQRTSSLTDITSALTSTPQLRVSTTGRSTTPSTSRLAPSKSDLHLNLTLSQLESPTDSAGGTPLLVSAVTAPAASLASPSSSITPMSPLRTSLDAMGIPRLRSRSEIDTVVRQEQIRQARRKFEERERAKEEKYDREQVKKRNRQATEEATRIEKETAQWYKATGVSSSGGPGCSSVNGSNVNVNLGESILQPLPPTKAGHASASRKATPTSIATPASVPSGPTGRSVGAGVFSGKRKGSFGMAGAAGSRPDLSTGGHPSSSSTASRKNSGFSRDRNANVDAEKGVAAFIASNYDNLPDNFPPRFGANVDDPNAYDWRRDIPRRSSTVKKATQTYWQGFMLWLRTKIFKLSRR